MALNILETIKILKEMKVENNITESLSCVHKWELSSDGTEIMCVKCGLWQPADWDD